MQKHKFSIETSKKFLGETGVLVVNNTETRINKARSFTFLGLGTEKYRKNPNAENLKIALEDIIKNPPKAIFPKKKQLNKIVLPKSDIEQIIESQSFRRKMLTPRYTLFN